jgi:hypothetical protein
MLQIKSVHLNMIHIFYATYHVCMWRTVFDKFYKGRFQISPDMECNGLVLAKQKFASQLFFFVVVVPVRVRCNFFPVPMRSTNKTLHRVTRGGTWSALCCSSCAPREGSPGAHWSGSWIHLKTKLNLWFMIVTKIMCAYTGWSNLIMGYDVEREAVVTLNGGIFCAECGNRTSPLLIKHSSICNTFCWWPLSLLCI